MAASVTQQHILSHTAAYPDLAVQDILKFLHQSAFGCEHMRPSEENAVAYIKGEFATRSGDDGRRIEPLDGSFSRVHLSCLFDGLSPDTLARLFCLSAKTAERGRERLREKIEVTLQLAADGMLPFSHTELSAAIEAWRDRGYPAMRHSERFREAYHPAYRVIANEYVRFLPLFLRLDAKPQKGRTVLAVEGGSASGKSTLAALLQHIYGCTVFHMDDFFLQPRQRTAERLSEAGGNVDRERVYEEILRPLIEGRPVRYRPYDCSTQALQDPVTVEPAELVVIEGAYSMHPLLRDHYDISVFLDVDPALQKARIQKRNTPPMAERFFAEWIPLEHRYFDAFAVKSSCDLVIPIEE